MTRERPLSEKIYRRIRSDIMGCVLAPGESCSESQLAEVYGVSKAPVRWALAALSREGLVTARPRQGHTVAPVTIESVNDLFGVRMILEPAAARLAAGHADIERLKQLHARVTEGCTFGDRRSERRWVDANNQFHIEITRAAGNERLTRITMAVLEESQRVMHVLISVFEEVRSMGQDHRDLISALAKGDGEGAARVAREHLEHSRRIVMDALLGNATTRGLAANGEFAASRAGGR
ncbi:MAG TPA: GntR family transcriptional regulator [Reyranella sp.]|nr:GntR family transcriptional regulator [Reyranella sp.]